jgi:uncharacterized protein (TIGR03435 family)
MRVLFAVFLAASALAQNPAPPAFEVASVKINRQYNPSDSSTWRGGINVTPDGVTIRNQTLRMITAWAERVQRAQVAGPDWIDTERYDIQAKAGQKATPGEMRGMARALLAERFQFKGHRETRTVEAMALVEPKSGHKMKASTVEGPTESEPFPTGGAIVRGAALGDFLEDLSRELTLPVVDRTGLKGRWDFTLNPEKYVHAFRASMMTDPNRPSEPEARAMLLEQILMGELGLRIERRKEAIEFVVIDHADKTPVEN